MVFICTFFFEAMIEISARKSGEKSGIVLIETEERETPGENYKAVEDQK